MKELLDNYVNLCKKINELKVEHGKLEMSLLAGMAEMNKERVVIGTAMLQIYYRHKYDYDKKGIYNILEPKGLFFNAAAVIHKNLNDIIARDGTLTDDETGNILECIKVVSATPYLKVRLIGPK
jgi:hypothetical protein